VESVPGGGLAGVKKWGERRAGTHGRTSWGVYVGGRGTTNQRGQSKKRTLDKKKGDGQNPLLHENMGSYERLGISGKKQG